MGVLVLVRGNVFDGFSDVLTGPTEILVEGNRIAQVERSVGRPLGATVINLSERTASPGFIDTHVHLTMDAANRRYRRHARRFHRRHRRYRRRLSRSELCQSLRLITTLED